MTVPTLNANCSLWLKTKWTGFKFNSKLLRSRPFYQLPVTEDGKLVGVLRMHDLLKEGF